MSFSKRVKKEGKRRRLKEGWCGHGLSGDGLCKRVSFLLRGGRDTRSVKQGGAKAPSYKRMSSRALQKKGEIS